MSVRIVPGICDLDVNIEAIGIDVVLVDTVFSAIWDDEGTRGPKESKEDQIPDEHYEKI